MTEDAQLLNDWYRYAAGAEGFIGAALKTHRTKAFISQEQQRNLLGILDAKYDQFWLQLQAMSTPRANQFEADVQQIVEYVRGKTEVEAPVDTKQLAELIHIGLEP